MKPIRGWLKPPTKCSSRSTTLEGREGNKMAIGNLARRFWMAQRFNLAFAIAFSSCGFLLAQEPPPRLTPINRDEVWQAVTGELRQRGVREEQLLRVEEIELPTAVPAFESRTLRVSMVCWDADLSRAQ